MATRPGSLNGAAIGDDVTLDKLSVAAEPPTGVIGAILTIEPKDDAPVGDAFGMGDGVVIIDASICGDTFIAGLLVMIDNDGPAIGDGAGDDEIAAAVELVVGDVVLGGNGDGGFCDPSMYGAGSGNVIGEMMICVVTLLRVGLGGVVPNGVVLCDTGNDMGDVMGVNVVDGIAVVIMVPLIMLVIACGCWCCCCC